MNQPRPSTADKRRSFRRMHDSGCFLIPNPWDVGSARYLQSLDFKALATTSSGYAWTLGLADGKVPRERVLEHLKEIVEATDLPISADFENGYGRDAAAVGHSVRLALATGIAGLSIEDSTGDTDAPLFPIEIAVERLRAARQAIDDAGGDTVLVGRAECFVVGQPDLNETIARLRAYAKAGADCLFAPGIRSPEDIHAIVNAVAPKPVNLLVGSTSPLSMAQIADLGVRRVSVGGALARSAWGGFMRAATHLRENANFDGFANSASGPELNSLFDRASPLA